MSNNQINITRGSTSTREIKLYISELEDLPETFQAIFTVKKVNDTDETDSKAIIQKSYDFPTDFEEVEPEGEDSYWKTDLILTSEDTTHPSDEYVWNLRFIGNEGQFITDSSEGKLKISLRPTQRQDQIE
jgi:hypothetical protein